MKNEVAVRPRVFYRLMALSFIAVSLAAFVTGFIKGDLGARVREPWVQMHAAVFIAWQLLFLWQTMLIAADRPALHKRFGIALTTLAAVMLGLAIHAGVTGFAKNDRPFGMLSLIYAAIPHVDMILFTAFLCLAL